MGFKILGATNLQNLQNFAKIISFLKESVLDHKNYYPIHWTSASKVCVLRTNGGTQPHTTDHPALMSSFVQSPELYRNFIISIKNNDRIIIFLEDDRA